MLKQLENNVQKNTVNQSVLLTWFSILLLSLLCSGVAIGQSVKPNVGKEFVFAIPPNYGGVTTDGSFLIDTVQFLISADSAASGTIQYANGSPTAFSVTAGGSVSINLDNVEATGEGVLNQTVKIISNQDITVNVINRNDAFADSGVGSADGFSAIPVSNLGDHYMIIGNPPAIKTEEANQTQLRIDPYHYLGESVTITITPIADIETVSKGTADDYGVLNAEELDGPLLQGQTYEIPINSGEALVLSSSSNLSGQLISADSNNYEVNSADVNVQRQSTLNTFRVANKKFNPSPLAYSSYIAIAAAYDGTEVQINPIADFETMAQGQPQTIQLNQGQSIVLRARDVDLTGQVVESNKPISVVSSTGCVSRHDPLYRAFSCSYQVEMMPPVSGWGKTAILSRTNAGFFHARGTNYRVMAAFDDTEIFEAGQHLVTIHQGEVYTPPSTVDVVTANKPILVTRETVAKSSALHELPFYSNGPALALVPTQEQYLQTYYFEGGSSVEVVIATDALDSLLVNGAPITENIRSNGAIFGGVPTAIGDTGYSTINPYTGFYFRPDEPFYKITASEPFRLIVTRQFDHHFNTHPANYGLPVQPDNFAPNISLAFNHTTINGTATDSEDTNGNGVLDSGEDLNNDGVINPRSEDTNGNGSLDAGEDIDSDGAISLDKGLAAVSLAAGSENLNFSVDTFNAGDLAANFSLEIIDHTQRAIGTLVVEDQVGNQTQEVLDIPGSVSLTAYSNGDGSTIAVNWEDNNVSENIQDYLVYVSEQPINQLTPALLVKTVSNETKSTVVDGLTVDTNYYVAVVARSHSGNTSIFSAADVLLPGMQFLISAIAPNGSYGFENFPDEFFGLNIDNAVVQHLRQLNTWNEVSDLEIPNFHVNNVYEVSTHFMCWSSDNAYLTLGFYDAVDTYLGELRFLKDGTYRGRIEYEAASGQTTVIRPGYGSYSGWFRGLLSFTDSQIIFNHSEASYGIDNFTLDVDMSNVATIKASSGVYATHSPGNCGSLSWMKLVSAETLGSTVNSVFTIDTTVAYPVNNLVPQASNNGNIQLTWSEPDANQNFIDQYVIQIDGQTHSTVPAANFTEVYGVKAYSVSLDNLPLGTVHNINVLTQSLAGKTSDPVATSVLAAYATATNLQVTEAVNGRIGLSWDAHEYVEGVSEYRVYISDQSITTVDGLIPHATLNNLARSTTIRNLINGQQYYLAVTTVNTDGVELQSVTPLTVSPVKLPDNLSVTAQNNGDGSTLLVSWEDTNSPSDIQDYLVYLSEQTFTELTPSLLVKTVAGGSSSTVIDGLNIDTDYYLTVVARNHQGLVSEFYPPEFIRTFDTTIAYPVNNVDAVIVSDTETQLTWSEPSDNENFIDKYLIELNGEVVQEVAAASFTEVNGVKTYTANLDNLPLGDVHTLTVVTQSLAGKTNDGVDINVVTPYPAPSGLTVSNAQNNQVTLTWNAHSNTQGVSAYRVYISDAPITDVTGMTPVVIRNISTSHPTQATVGSLNNDQSYHFAVTTVNTNGYERTLVSSITATPVDTLAPNDVTGLSVTTDNSQNVMVNWQLPTTNHADIDKIQIIFDGVVYDELPATATSYQVTQLSPSTTDTITLKTVDTSNNISTGASLFIAMPYANPGNVQIVSEGDRTVALSWSLPANTSGVQHYAVYVSESPLSSVAGLTPQLTANPNQSAITIGELTNFTDYFFAVTTVNIHGYENPAVTSIKGTPVVETDGPVIDSLRYGNEDFTDGFNAGLNQSICAVLTDASPISRVEFLIDGQLVNTDSNANDGYCYNIDLETFTDGTHAFELKAYDVYENLTTQSLSFTIQLAAPTAPQITSPADASVTNLSRLEVQVQSQAGLDVQLLIGEVSTDWLPVNATGTVVFDINLAEGDNTLQVKARNRSGEGEYSSPITVTLDTTLPPQPIALQAESSANGQVRLQWTVDTQAEYAGFNVYRSEQPFTDSANAIKLNTTPITEVSFDDVLFEDGTYYYRVDSQNALGTSSQLSSMVEAVADATPPVAEEIAYSIDGAFDEATQTYGQGVLTVTLTVSEDLLTTPFLSLAPEGGSPITVPLTAITGQSRQYQGLVGLDENVQSGVTYAVFSARDQVGNRGTDVLVGDQLLIDTAGPVITAIATSPASPIQNDAANPVTVVVDITLDEALPEGDVPQLSYRLTNSQTDSVVIDNLTNISGNQWQGSLVLGTDAGQAQPESLTFSYSATDALGNTGTRITNNPVIQVYQGELPPLGTPLNFTAQSLSGGRVQLSWFDVSGAEAYQLYRQSPTDVELVPYQRLEPGNSYIDQTGIDGEYQYSLASIRQENGQESFSALATPVTVTTDSVAPDAPQNLSLELFPIGIQAAWEPIVGETVSYRLYRADSGPILSTEGLTPVLDGLVEPFVVDTSPNQSLPAYVVVAVDANGNESEPSDTAYLNVDLLPIATIGVRLDDGGIPLVSWTHSRPSINQFDIFLGADETGVALNDTVLTEFSYSDTGYGNNERQYSVVAIDSNQQRSLARTITLPKVDLSIVTGQIVKRNVINQIEVRISNQSAHDVRNTRIKLISSQGTFQSATVTLPANDSITVPVTVAGLTTLPDVWDVSLEMHAQPNGGETIEVATNAQIEVREGALSLGLETNDFIRGATGDFRVELENTGAETIQLMTARNTGQADSADILFTLVDGDENVLSSARYRQSLGEGILTNAAGDSLAMITAGQRWQSELVTISVPENAPEEIYLVTTIDRLYANRGTSEEVQVKGPSIRQRIVLEQTSYTGNVTSVTPSVSFGNQPIVIEGQALDRSSQVALANVDLTVVVTVGNYERTFDVQTDSEGNYQLTYTPQSGESGRYRISALHPILTGRPADGEFIINRLTQSPDRVSLSIPYLLDYELPIQLTAGDGTELTNLRYEFRAVDQPTGQLPRGITVTVPEPIQISSQQSQRVTLGIQADDSAINNGQIFVALFADGYDEQPIGMLDILYNLSEAKPVLSHAPSVLEMGTTVTGTATATITLDNRGLVPLTDVNLVFKTVDGFEAPQWLKLVTPANLGDVAVGDQRTVDIAVQPNNAAPIGTTRFNLEVQSSNAPNYIIPVYAAISESGEGGVLLKVTDMYSGTLNGVGNVIQGLPSAEVRIQNEALPDIEYQLTTDELGEVFVEDIPAGRYSIWVSEPNYQEEHIRIRVQPGLVQSEQVFLDYNLIRLDWSVNEITISDSYEITLRATFETDVPAAVVMLEPTTIPLPEMEAGDVFHGELTMTNYGLIRAFDVNFRPQQSDEFFQIEYLTDVIPDSLAPKEVVVIPYKVTALKSLEQQDASGGGCGVYSNCSACDAKSSCPTGISETNTSSCMTRSYGSCSGGSGGSDVPSRPAYSSGASGGGGASSGGSYTPSTPPSGFPTCRDGGSGCGQ